MIGEKLSRVKTDERHSLRLKSKVQARKRLVSFPGIVPLSMAGLVSLDLAVSICSTGELYLEIARAIEVTQ